MKRSKIYYIAVLLLGILSFSCSVKKFVPEGKRLYTGAEIKIKADSAMGNLSDLKSELQTVLRPEPNSTFLGMRPGLFYFYKNQKEKPGFLNRWLFKQLGEEPVYQSDVKTFEVEEILRNRLENDGYFYSTVASSFNEGEIEASLTYKLNVASPYKLERFQLDSMPSSIYENVQDILKNSPFSESMRFDLSDFKSERKRLDSKLKNKGFYNMNPDFFIFQADTNQYRDKRFDLFLKLKKEVPTKATVPYKIKEINVYPNFEFNEDSLSVEPKRFNEKNYLQNKLHFKPKYLDQFVTIDEGDYYDPNASKNTSRRLSSIGAYKYVNIQYKELDSSLTDSLGQLQANIFLSPLNKRAVRAELQAVTKSNNFTGPNLALTYSNRNLFYGGETLNISSNIGYETQFASGDDAGLSSLEYGLSAELIFPRVLAPFTIDDDFFKYSVPKTKTSLGVNFLQRSKLFTLLTGSALFGYSWNANRYITYDVNPISINYTRLIETSDEFEDILDDNPFLRQSFEQQFISGLTMSFTYNGMVDTNKRSQFFINSTFDIAGNSLSLFGKETNAGNAKTIFGLEYAQYAKVDLDVRHHFNFGENKSQTLAARLFAGYGLAYGNSEVVPFVKQYSAGGPFSVRAFKIRSLGPGTYNDDNETASNNSFFDKTGNIRLEANIEYRFPLFSFFNGAIFADAGNVWNSTANPIFNGTDTFSSNFINELGMGTGIGLHIDIQGFVIRFDLAAPFHDPSLPEGERFEFRPDEPVLNFAVGYSF